MAEETRTPTAHAGSSGGESRPERSGGDRPERSGPRGPRPGGGPGGPREGGRKYFRRKKVCKFCVEKIEAVNYKDVRLLAQFVRSWTLCGPRVPSSGAGTGSRCRWPPRFCWSRVTPPPHADNPGPLVRCDRTQKYSGVPSGPGPDRHSHESRCGGSLRHNSRGGGL